jgi:hypothetical protein
MASGILLLGNIMKLMEEMVLQFLVRLKQYFPYLVPVKQYISFISSSREILLFFPLIISTGRYSPIDH